MSAILAADIGGTKTLVALAGPGDPLNGVVFERLYASREYPSLEAILDHFLAQPEAAAHAGDLAAACFSVAGPVEGDATRLTNLDWRIAADAIGQRYRIPAVRLLNDFEAAGLGIPRLEPGDLACLQAGRAVPGGTCAVIGAGTGLGAAWLEWNGAGYDARASEAGHADFAPRDEIQDALLAYLRRNFGHVSWERVVSGPGLMRIFSFLQERGLGIPSREMLAASKGSPDTTAVISDFGATRRDPLAVRALDIFVSAYGAFAGNAALATLARGGVYIAGGIAPRIVAKLQEGAFMRAFVDKGRFRTLLGALPVNVVMNPKLCLNGALLMAANLAGARSAAGRGRD